MYLLDFFKSIDADDIEVCKKKDLEDIRIGPVSFKWLETEIYTASGYNGYFPKNIGVLLGLYGDIFQIKLGDGSIIALTSLKLSDMDLKDRKWRLFTSYLGDLVNQSMNRSLFDKGFEIILMNSSVNGDGYLDLIWCYPKQFNENEFISNNRITGKWSKVHFSSQYTGVQKAYSDGVNKNKVNGYSLFLNEQGYDKTGVPDIEILDVDWSIFTSKYKGVFAFYKEVLKTEQYRILGKSNNAKVLRDDYLYLLEFGPSKLIRGLESFSDYSIFEYELFDMFVFESPVKDNATYVVWGDWLKPSTMSRTQIIRSKYPHVRIWHNDNWKDNIYELFESEKERLGMNGN